MNGYTYGDNNPVMMVDPDGHWAYRFWGTTPMPYHNNRTAYAHVKGVKSGLVAVRDSYAGFVGMGNGLNKAFTFGVAGLLDGKHLKITQKENCKLISWTACCKTANHKKYSEISG